FRGSGQGSPAQVDPPKAGWRAKGDSGGWEEGSRAVAGITQGERAAETGFDGSWVDGRRSGGNGGIGIVAKHEGSRLERTLRSAGSFDFRSALAPRRDPHTGMLERSKVSQGLKLKRLGCHLTY